MSECKEPILVLTPEESDAIRLDFFSSDTVPLTADDPDEGEPSFSVLVTVDDSDKGCYIKSDCAFSFSYMRLWRDGMCMAQITSNSRVKVEKGDSVKFEGLRSIYINDVSHARRQEVPPKRDDIIKLRVGRYEINEWLEIANNLKKNRIVVRDELLNLRSLLFGQAFVAILSQNDNLFRCTGWVGLCEAGYKPYVECEDYHRVI